MSKLTIQQMLETPVDTIKQESVPFFLSYFTDLLKQREEDYKIFGQAREDIILDKKLNSKINILQKLLLNNHAQTNPRTTNRTKPIH
jgi:hypothetical protein